MGYMDPLSQSVRVRPIVYKTVILEYKMWFDACVWIWFLSDWLAVKAPSMIPHSAQVCHGPCALANAKMPDSEELIVKDQEVTAFTNGEEDAVNRRAIVPWTNEAPLCAGVTSCHPLAVLRIVLTLLLAGARRGHGLARMA